MQLTINFGLSMMFSCDLENQAISVERVKEYSELEMEVTINRKPSNV